MMLRPTLDSELSGWDLDCHHTTPASSHQIEPWSHQLHLSLSLPPPHQGQRLHLHGLPPESGESIPLGPVSSDHRLAQCSAASEPVDTTRVEKLISRPRSQVIICRSAHVKNTDYIKGSRDASEVKDHSICVFIFAMLFPFSSNTHFEPVAIYP